MEEIIKLKGFSEGEIRNVGEIKNESKGIENKVRDWEDKIERG